jgi:hypothetical protein
MNTTVHRPTELLRSMLEEQRRTHTIRLTQFMICGKSPDATGPGKGQLRCARRHGSARPSTGWITEPAQ